MGGRWSRAWPIGAILLGGLTLRLIFAFVLFPGQGHANDLGLFSSWASTLAQAGPGTFYSSEGSANYPPGYLYVLWLVGALGGGVELLKPPAILADVGIGALLFVAGRRWFGERAGLIAAALYLFVPVTWYDSALWGQVDAVGALVMLASIVLLIEGWSEPAAALAGVAVLVKPQDAIVLVILIPVLVRRHLLAVGRGPRPALGPVLRAVDGRLGGLLSTQGPVRLATSAIAFAAVVVAGLLPFDIARFAPASLADVPVVAQVTGLVGLVVSDTGQYAVLSANAFNAWALVGDSSIASLVSTGGTWTADTLPVLGGIPAFAVGTALLVATGLVVAGGLLRRDDRIAVLLAFALVAFAFYALPTRVHERYLLPFFAPAALLAALSLPAMGGYVAVALLNAANLHAVLVGTHLIGTGVGFGAGRGGSPGSAGPEMGFGGGGGPGGGFGGGSAAGAISLPFADVFANETAVTLIALGQTLGFVALLVAWVVLVLRRPETATSRPTLAVSLRRA